MKTINIEGVIGWDVSAADVRQQIKDAKGEDLTIEINSPGGIVTEGIAIYNAIKSAQGQKTTRIVGLAASMGSYIALAADRVIAEPNAIYMVHNAQGIGMGDHNTLRKTADIIEGMSKMLARAYVAKTGKSDKEIARMMDDETFLFGTEIREAGFADEINGEATDDKSEAILRTRVAVASAEDLLKRLSTEHDLDQVAACLAEYIPKEKTAGVASVQAAGPKDTKEVKKMTDQEFNALKADAYQDGIRAERQRVAALAHWKNISAEADKVADEAIASGKTYDEVAAQLAAAVASGKSKPAEGNAPEVTTGVVDTAAGVTGGISADDQAAMAMFGMSAEDYRKYGKE